MNLRILNPLAWRRGLLFSVLLLMLIIWFGFIDTYSIRTRIQLHNEKQELIEATDHLLEETSKYQNRIQNLESNPELLERLAREEYGMRKPGETIYRIQEN
ncbi:MAG: septum formation initiator family protein [Balneolales bacterium]